LVVVVAAVWFKAATGPARRAASAVLVASSSTNTHKEYKMKCLIYLVSTGQSALWLDTDVPYPNPMFANFELDPDNIPPEYVENAMAFGYWVRDGALTTVPPPPTLPELVEALTTAVRAKRAEMIAMGVLVANSVQFAPDAAQLARLADLAVDPMAFGRASIDIELGTPPVWQNILAADLQAGYAAYVARREVCYSNERAHIDNLRALLAAEDRAALDAYDVTVGWPA
jgi:hypothetical protein